jgi:Zn finger protein HypA/HybF involved in hydrogenase expression
MMRFPEVYSGEMMCVKPKALAKYLELVMECTMNSYPKQCTMRFPEVYSGEMTCVKPKALAKYLELVMECTMNGCPKQCMMRFREVYSGLIVRTRSCMQPLMRLIIPHPQSNTGQPLSWAFHYGLFPLAKVNKRRKYTAG